MTADKTKTTSLNDFLDEASPAPQQGKALPEAFQEIRSEGTQSMGTFLDAVGADLSTPPDEDEEEIHDPLASLGSASDPEDHRSFLASMGVPVTPAPVQRRVSDKVVDGAKLAVESVQKNWVPSLLMAIALTVIVFFLTGVFTL